MIVGDQDVASGDREAREDEGSDVCLIDDEVCHGPSCVGGSTEERESER